MRAQDIVLGEHYRLKDSPFYGYVKVLKVLKKNEEENNKPYSIVKVEHTVEKNDKVGIIRYFRPPDLIKE